jgi:small subunit ribosomal protein S11
MSVSKAKTGKKNKRVASVRQARIYIKSSYNNTLISATDTQGNVLAQSSAGHVGFSGTRKATPYAAQQAVADVMEKLKPYSVQEASVFVKGIGSAREAAIRSLSAGGLTITLIKDQTPIPHNGVRAPKKRRV